MWAADTFLTTWTGQVGTATNSGNFKYATKKVKIAAGETYVYTLTNFNDGNNSNYWKNWVVEGNLGSKYFDCEARGNQWQAGEGPVPTYTPVMAYTDVENFQTAYNGANVTITISRNAAGTEFTVTHTSNVLGTTDGNTEKYYGGTWTVTVGAEEDWDIYITEEESHFVVTSVTYTDAGSDVTNYNPIYQRGYTTAWSDDDLGSGKWTGNGTCTANVNGLNIAHANGSRTWTNTSQISPTSGYILKYDIIWNTGASYGTSNEAYLKIGDAVTFTTSSQGQYGKVTIGSNDAISISNACSNGNGNRDGDVWTIHMVVNTTTHKVTELTINGNKGTTKVNYSLASEMSFSVSASFSSLTIGTNKTNTASSLWCGIKSINIDQEAYSAPKATITYKYEDLSGNSLSAYHADVQNNEVIGTNISELVAGDLIATFYNGTSNKYVYSSYSVTDDYTKVQEGGNTVTLKFTDYPSTAYTVKAQVGGSDLTTLTSGTAYFDGSTTEYWSKYIKESDQWYVADEATYGAAITAANTNVAFTVTDAIDYFFEAEDMTYSRTYSTYEGTAASNGSAKTLYGNANAVTTTTVAAGVYTVSLNGIKWQDGYEDTYQIAFSTDNTNWTPLGTITYANGEEGVKTLAGAIIPAESYIRIWTTGGVQTPRRHLDYMTLQKTDNIPATENIVVSSAGYATYVSNYNLDFTSAATKAYKVSVADKGVATMTEVAKVPAKTPVLLYVSGGNGSGEAIPVTTDAVSAVSGNNLVAGADATVATIDGEYTNMILNKIGDNVGFYFANGQTVAANRAYLHFATSLAPDALAPMMLVFDNETTGINEVKGEGLKVNGYYDLQGRKVAQPTKGLYIVNGKKVVIK